ncbi:uncharacterized protein LOC123706270 [Colias croceus]|uniref:uncharacterized protein LOC123706270 n=1 Tax=Colias crocea TaxID=72248 RepID=UPI001E27E0C2|nr:uncharacterized protein LOC123706270 [Colias croceus]
MPFKIVETVEKGKCLLFIVPSLWETNGILKWPKNCLDVRKLVMNENCLPATGWSASRCRVKRHSIPSFSEAERELGLMLERSDTDDTDREIQNSKVQCQKEYVNYNALAEQLVFKTPTQPSTSSASLHPDLDASTAAEYIVQYVVNEPDVETNSGSMVTLPFETQIPIETQQNNDVNQTIQYLQKILQNQYNMEQKINILETNQKKIFHKLASLSVQLEDGFSKQDLNKNADVVSLAESKLRFDSEAFIIKPIDSIADLEKMESFLLDKKNKIKLLTQYSFVCPKSEGKGATCAYKILDMFLSREFLCKCSWTGGSRKSEETKFGLKKYKNILNFFFELVRSWDGTYTLTDNENFFKSVLKNSGKRKLNKNERASTKRIRTKKTGPRQEKQNAGNQEEIQNDMETNEEISENIANDAESSEREEDEESLC